ncbi:General amino acid permease [Wickerhamomyces ciferrii]|uniref:General amino acid permease n=1 Tax=Wickerhamomyces ciferrii (strain ATCC 14091 / BCRC 22168 / CBS 111 / JCM 3599 / NBRC 0793 / NRRL Y-1031 F-60-10) TaxID=1206466 RepID=K0KGT3_WICCF|nr:General amino acid permease [Wickerhamomyces ciferrii]CCH41392.1 General amino acid permease [Wickerhamomyces ciferrii]
MKSNQFTVEDGSVNSAEVGSLTDVILHKDSNGDVIKENGLKAGLQNRMINLIALCGIIGPGMFIGIGNMLAKGGPVSMIVGFGIVGILVIFMMFAVGELNSIYDENFAILGSRFISKGFGATISLYYVIIWVTILISEYTSLTAALQSYTTKIPMYGWFLIFFTIFTCFQTLEISWWGESEYILGMFKLIFITGFYLFAIIFASGGIPNHKPDNPFGKYPLNSGFKGIASSFVYAGVFYAGVEGISLLTMESKNPRKAIPSAVKSTVYRVFYVYIGLSIAYGITVAYNDPILNSGDGVLKSPMMIALTNAGWTNSKYFVTTFIWITCFSSINTAIYFASRSLFAWAQEGYGPKIFTKVTKKGVPYVAIHFVHIFSFLAILSYSSGSRVAYTYIISVTGVATFIVWVCICGVHLRFRYAWIKRNLPLDNIPYLAPCFPYGSYFGAGLGIVLVLVQGWTCFVPFDYKSFIDGYIMLPLFFIIWGCYDYFYFKKGLLKVNEIDFESTRLELTEDVDKLL